MSVLRFRPFDSPLTGREGARFWPQVLAELKNRAVEDVLIAVGDGLKGQLEAINTAWEQTVVQRCIVHLIRNSFRFAGRQRRRESTPGDQH